MDFRLQHDATCSQGKNGRMMANRPVKIDQASVITAEIAQGAGRGRTTTKITVTRPGGGPH
jgi:hypothetical protein